MDTKQWPVPACRTTLVTASWMMRNAEVSMSAGSGRCCPCHSTSTWTPASAVVAASLPTPARPSAGSTGAVMPASAWRSAPSIRRSPARVSRLVVSIAARALPASAGWVSMTRLPAPAWIAMMPMLCATMSCSSRAIRSRSAVAACASAWARSASAWVWLCRIELPISQPMKIIAPKASASGLVGRVSATTQPVTTPTATTVAAIEVRGGRVAAMTQMVRLTSRTSSSGKTGGNTEICQDCGVAVAATQQHSRNARTHHGLRRTR